MAITTYNQCLSSARPAINFHKPSATAEGAATFHSLWALAGYPIAGATPPAYTAGSGYIPTNATAGSIPFINPASGETILSFLNVAGGVSGTLIIYDRLWHCSGFTTAAAATLPVTTPGTINRYTDFTGIELWGEVYSAPGATGATWTCSYTNQAGTTGRTATYTHPANAESVGQMLPFLLDAGDTGVQSIASFTTSATSGTAGSIGVTLLKRLAEIPLCPGVKNALDVFSLGAPRIRNNACLAFMVQCSGTSTGVMSGSLIYSQG
jgi:hypothetical protein